MSDEVKSNGYIIRSMSDAELAKFLYEVEEGSIDFAKTFCDLCCKDAALEMKSVDCAECALWWVTNDAKLPQGLKYWEAQNV